MPAIYEFEGKTKEEAVTKACEELDVGEEQLEIEVLSYGATGIFGLVGAKKARIRVSLQGAPEAKIDEEKPCTSDEIEKVAEIARKTLGEIISFIVDDAVVAVAKHSDSIRLKIETSNPALLIGRHGRTLNAIQYLVRKVIRKENKAKLHISFDVEGYRDRRKASLTQLAMRLGEKVKRSGRPATISPMNAYDRRIVHIALKDNTSVKTRSKGGGLFRELVILPQRGQR
ncbi:MAG: protein jag [Desulfobacterales bacterium]|nr:protein jag [Desulfobacterales bacterium]